MQSADSRAAAWGERGASLVTTLLLLVSLSVLGIAALTETRSGTKVAFNDALHKQLLIAAEAGLEAGRGVMIQQPVGGGGATCSSTRRPPSPRCRWRGWATSTTDTNSSTTMTATAI